MQVMLNQIEELIENGLADHAAWQDVLNLIDRRRRLCESENKRLLAAQQMISAEELMATLGAVIDVIRRYVTDRAVLGSISRELSELTMRDEERTAGLLSHPN